MQLYTTYSDRERFSKDLCELIKRKAARFIYETRFHHVRYDIANNLLLVCRILRKAGNQQWGIEYVLSVKLRLAHNASCNFDVAAGDWW